MANTKKKTVGQKIDAKIEKIAKVDDIVITEATQEVGTLTVKRWQVALVAAVITVLTLVVVL